MTALQHALDLDQTADVYLYELKGYNTTKPNEYFRFVNMVGVMFNGPWHPLACSHNVLEVTSTGTQPRVEITISDAAGTVSSLLNEIDALEGSKLKIIYTKARFLDTGSTPSTNNGIIQQSNMIISRIVNYLPGDSITCEASSPIDIGVGDVAAPARVCLRTCTWAYRSTECGYTGSQMVKLDNTPTINPSEDRCAKTLTACRIRDNILRYGGFPTLQRR